MFCEVFSVLDLYRFHQPQSGYLQPLQPRDGVMGNTMATLWGKHGRYSGGNSCNDETDETVNCGDVLGGSSRLVTAW